MLASLWVEFNRLSFCTKFSMFCNFLGLISVERTEVTLLDKLSARFHWSSLCWSWESLAPSPAIWNNVPRDEISLKKSKKIKWQQNCSLFMLYSIPVATTYSIYWNGKVDPGPGIETQNSNRIMTHGSKKACNYFIQPILFEQDYPEYITMTKHSCCKQVFWCLLTGSWDQSRWTQLQLDKHNDNLE